MEELNKYKTIEEDQSNYRSIITQTEEEELISSRYITSNNNNSKKIIIILTIYLKMIITQLVILQRIYIPQSIK
jgi:hypothetical protein